MERQESLSGSLDESLVLYGTFNTPVVTTIITGSGPSSWFTSCSRGDRKNRKGGWSFLFSLGETPRGVITRLRAGEDDDGGVGGSLETGRRWKSEKRRRLRKEGCV